MQVRLSAMVKKEMIHIMRDPWLMLVVLVTPVILILLFGFTISTDVNNIEVAFCASKHSEAVRETADRLAASPYFDVKGYIDPTDIDWTLRSGKASAVVVFSDDYAITGNCQIIVDGADVNTARTSQAYLQSAIGGGGDGIFEIHYLYNPQLKSSYNFVPGIMGMIFLLVCAMLTSVSIVKEKETGSMEVLLVSPVKPIYIIISKMVPYFLLSVIDLVTILLLSRFVLGVPLEGGVWGIIGISLLYLLLALSLGMLISDISKNQIMALLLSAMVMMVPVICFSGMMFPIENMPWALRWISYIIPARWYIDAIRKLMIEGLPFKGVLMEFGILLSETLLLLAAATKKFNDRLE